MFTLKMAVLSFLLKQYALKWKNRVYGALILSATIILTFWASVFLYSSFYFTYLPEESFVWPVYLSYQSCEKNSGLCSFPKGSINITDPIRGSPLIYGQKYRILLDLEMPESPANRNNGMFLVSLMLKSESGKIQRSTTRSVMLRYKSSLHRYLATLILSPGLLYGLTEEKQTLHAELFSGFEETINDPVAEIHVVIMSKFVELYSMQVRIHAVFTGLRYLMHHYPVFSSIFGIGVVMSFLSLVVLSCWYQTSVPRNSLMIQNHDSSFKEKETLDLQSKITDTDSDFSHVSEEESTQFSHIEEITAHPTPSIKSGTDGGSEQDFSLVKEDEGDAVISAEERQKKLREQFPEVQSSLDSSLKDIKLPSTAKERRKLCELLSYEFKERGLIDAEEMAQILRSF